MSLFAATTAYISVDLVYTYIRNHDDFPRYGRLGRLIEATLVTAVVMVGSWIAAPFILDPIWTGVAGLAMYGFLFIPGVAVLWFLGREWIPPLGVSGLAFLAVAFMLGVVNSSIFRGGTPGDAFSDALTIPFIAGNALAIFIGVFIATTLTDSWRGDQHGERERARISSGPSTSTPTWNTPSSHDANDAVVAEELEVSPDGQPIPSPRGDRLSDAQLARRKYDWQYSTTRFSDIGGYDDVKADLERRVLEPLLSHGDGDNRFSRFGIEPERGILFYGPPGTGKTLFARALAGELTVPFVELSPADVTSMWINESSDQVKTLFNEAQEIGPCVIFLDEAEHLFGARNHSGKSSHAEDRKVTSEFLAQLTRDHREAIVIAATNRPGDIDRAIIRPGRLTAHFEIGLPDKEARATILRGHLNDIPSSVSDEEYAELATHTEGMTGADLVELVDRAKRNAADRDADTLTREDFPSNEDLKAEAAVLEPETGDLPDVEEEDRDDDDVPRDVAASSDGDDSNDSTFGYQ